jgi:cell division transport system permease protein
MKRISRYGLAGFIRNGFVSLAAILIMSITLFVVAWIMIISAGFQSVLQTLESKVDITVYFTTTATDGQIADIQKSLKVLPEVDAMLYNSREQALAEFQNRHKNDQLTMQALQELGDNPLGASLEIRAKDPSQYETIAKYLDTLQKDQTGSGVAIDKVNFSQNKPAIDRLSNVIDASRKVGAIVAIVLGIASVLIAFNTIRLAIYTARDEIGIMNLVGAGHWYVRGPFMIAGILYGITSTILVLLILYPLTAWMGPGSERFLGSFNVFTYFTGAFFRIAIALLVSGIALGALSSYLAVRRYLKA